MSKKLLSKQNLSLEEWQQFSKKIEKERGFDEESVLEQSLLLGEEVGELFKAIRRNSTDILDDNVNSKDREIANEMADILMYLFGLANRLNIDLEEAIKNKEKINQTRKWD